jgi:hypothetical protein
MMEKHDIYVMYNGNDDGFWVIVKGEKIHFQRERRDADLFVGELLLRVSKSDSERECSGAGSKKIVVSINLPSNDSLD